MRRKLLLAALAVFGAFSGGGNSLFAQVEPSNDGIYYIYNETSGLFLTRGQSWGTQAVAKPIGLPWKVSLADGKYTLRMYDITVTGSTTGFGDNAYTDNGSPIQFTPSGTAADGYTLQNGSNYITCPATAGAVSLSTTASSWQFLTQEQYDAVLAAKVSAQESAIATLKGITIPSGQTLNEVVTDVDNWAAAATVNDLPSSANWTSSKANDRSGKGNAINWGTYGTEMYEVSGGTYTRTITDLKPGIYKISARGMKRIGTNANCATMANAGWKVSDSYLDANGYIIRFKAWSEDRISDTNPNGTGEFVNIVNSGGYTTEGFVYVGSDGKLELTAHAEAWWDANWFLFNGISYTFYNNEVSDADASTILATANGIKDSKMGSGVKSALTSAISTFDGSRTIANYNALNTAISNAQASINSYVALQTAITNAGNYTIYKPVFTASNTSYSTAISTAQGVYDAGTVDDCAAAITALTNGIYGAYENDYSVFNNDYDYDYSTLLSQDLTEWATSDYVVMTANEHWNGQNSQRYYEQSSSEWGQNSWSHAASETATLPAGNYVMSITARASAEVTSTMSVKVGDNEAITVSLPNKGSVGRGITTAGVGSYADGTYANTNGRGWEYRYIAFTVEEESPVTISFSSSANASHNWVSIASPLLKGDVHPNQIKLNQVRALATTLTGYEGDISAETYATFSANITAAGNATLESSDLDAIITALQTDIATARAEAAAFERGAAMNALIDGANSVVLNDVNTAANWTPAPTYNDWSNEADGTGMIKPFLQDWISSANTLADNSHTYVPIRGLQSGLYEVSALVRVYSESGSEPSATSATFTVNGTSVNLLDGTNFAFNSMKGVYQTVSVKMEIEDALNISLAYSGANFNWIAWKNLKVTYLGTEAAEDADYTALSDAITAAEAKTLGFEAGEYAPYNNVAALEALAAANAIDQTAINVKSEVQAATTALTGATWTANAAEVNAVYWKTDYTADDKAASDGYVHPIGWTNTGYNTRIMCAANDATDNPAMTTIGTAVFSKFNTTYGEIEGYTMPLKANTTYKISFKYCGWSNNPTTNVVITGTTSNQAVVVTPSSFQPATNDGNTNAEHWYDFTAFFTPTASDNYVLALNKVETGQQQIAWADLSIVKGTVVNIEANGTASAAYDATQEGLVDKVVLNRPISAGYNTLVLPFDVTAEEVAANFGEGSKVYVVSKYESAKDNIKLTAREGIEANKPVILKATTAGTSYEFTNKTLVATQKPITEGEGVSMTGTYSTSVPVAKNDHCYVINGDKIYYVDSDVIIRNTRAYIYVAGANGIKSRVMGLSFGDEDATGINAVEGAKAADNDAIYNLSGQRVGKDYKGIVIKNGKKVMMR